MPVFPSGLSEKPSWGKAAAAAPVLTFDLLKQFGQRVGTRLKMSHAARSYKPALQLSRAAPNDEPPARSSASAD